MTRPSVRWMQRMLQHPQATPVGMAGAGVVALGLAGLVLARFGVGERGIFIALRATARWSFLLFWVAYVAGPARRLFGRLPALPPAIGRTAGLAYASAQLVHLGLVLWLYGIAREPPLPRSSVIIFGLGVFWTYLLAMLSLPAVSRWLGGGASRVVLQLGMHYIAGIFLWDFAKPAASPPGLLNPLSLPFTLMAVFGMVLHLMLVPGQVRAALRRVGGVSPRPVRDVARAADPAAPSPGTSPRPAPGMPARSPPVLPV